MVSEQTKSTADSIKNYIKQNGIEYQSLYDLLDVAKVAFEKENDTEWALKVTSYIKGCCRWAIQSNVEVVQMDDLYWKAMKAEAPYHFESFLFYMDKNRRPEKRFYEPRKKTLGVGRKKNRVLRFITSKPCWKIYYVYFLFSMGYRQASGEP